MPQAAASRPALSLASISSSAMLTYMSSGYTVPGTSTVVVGESTLTTAAAGTTEQGVSPTATGAAASTSTFAGSAGQLGSSLAGMVVAGAVAVFAL